MAEVKKPAELPPPWECQPDEPAEAFLAFRAYRDAPPDERHITRSASVRVEKLSKWFRDWSWADRVAAYDAHFDKIRVEEREAIFRRKAREVAIDHMVMIADAKSIVTREFGKLWEASRDSEMHGLIKPNDLIKMAELVVKMDRLVRGQSTENVGTANEIDVSKLSLEECRQLEGLLTKAAKTEDDEETETPGASH